MNIEYTLLFIGEGLFLTLVLTLSSLFLGLTIGTIFAILRYKGRLIFWISAFISLFRGTPLLLQLSFFYFAAPSVLGIKLSILTAGIITFGLNSAAYIAEILRAGIESLPQGQFEAAKTLRIPIFPMWKDIILPQVLKNVFPALVNEFITLLKETALISTLGGMDLMRRAQLIAAEQFTYFFPICVAGIYYYLLILLIEYAGRQIERKVFYAND